MPNKLKQLLPAIEFKQDLHVTKNFNNPIKTYNRLNLRRQAVW